jgi:hypothetical protein
MVMHPECRNFSPQGYNKDRCLRCATGGSDGSARWRNKMLDGASPRRGRPPQPIVDRLA